MTQTLSGIVKAGEYFSIGEPHERPVIFVALVDLDLFGECARLVEELRANPPEPDFVDEEGHIETYEFTAKLAADLKEKGLGCVVKPIIAIEAYEFPARPEYCYRKNLEEE